MKSVRFFLCLLVVVGVLTVSATSADAVGVFLQWQNAQDMDSGGGLGLSHAFQIIPIVALEARASWIRYGSSGGFESLNMFPLEAMARAKLGLFYAGIGAGYYIFSGDFPPENSFGGFLAGGGEFTLFGLGAFAELRYLYLEPDEDDAIGGTRDMSGFGASIGVILPFF